MATDQITAVSAQSFIKKVVEFGIPKSSLLSDTGLGDISIEDSNARISFTQYVDIVKRGLSLTQQPELGFKFGLDIVLGELGDYGYALMASETLADALRIGSRYVKLTGQPFSVLVEEAEDYWTLRFFPLCSNIKDDVWSFMIEAFLLSVLYNLSFLANKSVRISNLKTTYAEPSYSPLYEQFFHCSPDFGASETQVQIPTETTQLPILTANTDMAEYFTKQCDAALFELEQSDPFVDSIRRLIIDSHPSFPKFEEIAYWMDISPRTLHRRLKDRKTTFRQISDDIRLQRATSYLKNTANNINQISDLLGFMETNSFCRWFRKKTGVSASYFRKNDQV